MNSYFVGKENKSRQESRTPVKASQKLRFNETKLLEREAETGSLIRPDGTARSYIILLHINTCTAQKLPLQSRTAF